MIELFDFNIYLTGWVAAIFQNSIISSFLIIATISLLMFITSCLVYKYKTRIKNKLLFNLIYRTPINILASIYLCNFTYISIDEYYDFLYVSIINRLLMTKLALISICKLLNKYDTVIQLLNSKIYFRFKTLSN